MYPPFWFSTLESKNKATFILLEGTQGHKNLGSLILSSEGPAQKQKQTLYWMALSTLLSKPHISGTSEFG